MSLSYYVGVLIEHFVGIPGPRPWWQQVGFSDGLLDVFFQKQVR
jgi:hypothetical protein